MGIIETRVVFELKINCEKIYEELWLIETRVVFEFLSAWLLIVSCIRLIETRVVFELICRKNYFGYFCD